MASSCSIRHPEDGRTFETGTDRVQVKVSAGESGDAYTLTDHRMASGFALGLHRHDRHSETLCITAGMMEVFSDGVWVLCPEGTTVHIPPGTEHACRVAGDGPARMLMISQPGGLDRFYAERDAVGKDPSSIDALCARHDIINLGPVPGKVEDND